MISTKDKIVKALATGLYSGCSPWVPGTTGTIPALAIAWFLIGDNQPLLMISAILMTAVSVVLATMAEPLFGHDAKKIVIDEWAGMLISLLYVPFGWKYYLAAFVFFRIFDAIKIPPAAQAEKFPKGWGVTADDVVAGIQANLFTQLAIYLFPVWFAS